MRKRLLRSWLSVPLVLLSSVLAQSPPPATAAPSVPARPPAAAAEPLLYVVGASVSGGFTDGPLTGGEAGNETIALTRLLRAWADGSGVPVKNQSETLLIQMFTAPDRLGRQQIEAARKQGATVVVGVDFLFWYAYGRCNGEEAATRRQHLQVGLDLLATLPTSTTVVVGDLPDMRGAAPRMLAPSWVPSREVLAALNTEIAGWAKAHPNVRVFGLAKEVAAMRGDGVELPAKDGARKAVTAALLQGDRLHANRLGMAFLGHRLAAFLRQQLPEDQPLRRVEWSFEQFIAAAGAEADLAALPAVRPGTARRP